MRMIVAGGVVALVLLEAVATGLVASAIGVIPMLALGLLSTVAGMLLLRRQGWRTVRQMRAETAQGRLPAAARPAAGRRRRSGRYARAEASRRTGAPPR